MRILIAAFVVAAAALAITVATATAVIPSNITYTGQGFNANGTLQTSKCDAPDNGGTGAIVLPGQQYLLWVLNGKGVTAPVILYLPDGTGGTLTPHQMVNVGGTYKLVSTFFTRAQLLGAVHATYYGGPANNLVVSHGCGTVASHITTEIHQAGGHQAVTGALPLGSGVHDSAQVSVDNSVGVPAGSTVTFTFYKDAAVLGTETDPVSGSGNVDPALAETLLGAGSYKYTAAFNSGNTNLVRSSTSGDEPLTIDKAQLSIATTIHDAQHYDVGGTTHVGLGSVVHDIAQVTGAVSGFQIPDVSFTLDKGDGQGAQPVDTAATPDSQTNDPRSVDSAPLAAGEHYSYAARIGDNANYTGGPSAPEPLTVDKAQLHISTTIHDASHGAITEGALGSVVHDTATITGQVAGFTAPGAGEVSFTLDSHDGNGPQSVNKDNGNVDAIRTVDSAPLHAGSYTYAASVTGNDNYLPADSPNEDLTIHKAQLGISTVIHDGAHNQIGPGVANGTSLHDTATLTGVVPGFDPPAVSFALDGTGIGSVSTDNTETATYRSEAVTPAAGDHYFTATVGNNGDYDSATSDHEPFTVKNAGAFCSPGFWKNTSDTNWALTGYSRLDRFNDTVVPGGFYDTPLAGDPTLGDVTGASGNTYGGPSGPFGLNPFNAAGAFLSDNIPGFGWNGTTNGACPLSNGN